MEKPEFTRTQLLKILETSCLEDDELKEPIPPTSKSVFDLESDGAPSSSTPNPRFMKLFLQSASLGSRPAKNARSTKAHEKSSLGKGSRRGKGVNFVGHDSAGYVDSGLSTVATVIRRTSLNYITSVVSTAGGIINNVTGTDPSIFIDWTSAAAMFQQYRVLGLTYSYLPSNKYSKTTLTTAPIFCVTDYENVSALASYTSAASYVDGCTFATLEDGFVHNAVTPPAAPYNTWTDVQAPVNRYFIKLYGAGFSSSSLYGYVLIKLHIEFMGQS